MKKQRKTYTEKAPDPVAQIYKTVWSYTRFLVEEGVEFIDSHLLNKNMNHTDFRFAFSHRHKDVLELHRQIQERQKEGFKWFI